MTIASDVESPEELERLEARHICPEKALASLLADRKVSEHGLHRC